MGEGTADALARQWRKAVSDGALVLDGFHALKHAVRFGADVRLAVTDDKAAVLALASALADDLVDWFESSVTEVPADTLRTLLPRPHPTKTAGLASRPDPEANRRLLGVRPRPAPIVVLDRPRHLGNVGAVIRLAAGMGATGVVTTGDLDPWHPNAIRAAAGLHFAIPVERLGLDELPPGPVYALDPSGKDIRSLAIPDDALLAFGSERHGISAELRGRATELVSLPMRPQVSSYNLATSVAMALFHWLPKP